MKKLVLLAAMLLAFALGSKAQTSLVATLSHDGTVTTFYSANGLKDAYAAAVDGDIITLSPGSFVPVDIAKGITIRGAGMELENNPTIINGNFNIKDNPEGNGENHLTIEGVYVHGQLGIAGNINSPSFVKTRVKDLSFYSYSATITNAVFANCILDRIYLNGSSSHPSTESFIGCIIRETSMVSPTSASFSNCVITLTNSAHYSTFSNCIFTSGSSNYLSSNCTATYCYYAGTDSRPFYYIPYSSTNHVVPSDTEIFKNEDTCELTDEIASTWLGNDGSQVGIYGGTLPFNPVPSNPRITKFNVAPKTTADGKLSVEIEVKSN